MILLLTSYTFFEYILHRVSRGGTATSFIRRSRPDTAFSQIAITTMSKPFVFHDPVQVFVLGHKQDRGRLDLYCYAS